MSVLNPCDVCRNKYCGNCCLLASTNEYQCVNYDCFLNNEGDCLISVFDKCGAWRKDGAE